MESEKVILEAPMSYTGATKRIWRALPTVLAVVLLPFAWSLITGWYLFFGLLVAPYRLIRRGSRRRRLEELRHRELLDATRQAG